MPHELQPDMLYAGVCSVCGLTWYLAPSMPVLQIPSQFVTKCPVPVCGDVHYREVPL